jgi:hypothetical protein
MKKLEEILNWMVGVIILTNLYFLSKLIFLPYTTIILFCLVVSGYYFFKNFDSKKYLDLLNTWNVIFFLLFSFFLSIIEFLINGFKPNFNDLIRALLYLFYFNWTFILYKNLESLKKFFLILCSISLGILIIESYFDSKFPIAFNLVLPDTFHRDIRRVSGTLIDSNSFSTAVVVFIGIVLFTTGELNKFKKNILVFVLLVLGFYLVEISGSRQGFILYAVLILGYFWPKLKKEYFYYLVAFAVFFVILALAFQEQFIQYAVENPNSSISRVVFFNDNKMSSASNDERLNSLLGGLEYIKHNFFIYGPGGASYMESYYALFRHEVHVPHNGVLFLWGQYGLLFLVFMYFQFVSLKRAWKSKLFVFFLLSFIQFNFLPNSSYYCTSFLLFFFIDFNYLYFQNKEISELDLEGIKL